MPWKEGDTNTLDWSGGALTSLSHRFKTIPNQVLLRQITHFNLSNNQLPFLDQLTHLENIQNIDASCNLLCRLSCFACVKCTLTHLNLSTNQIKQVNGLESLKILTYLDVSNNLIETLPLLHLPCLKHLDLSGNRLGNIPNLSALSNLSTLLLSRNSIASLAHCSKHFPAALKILDLSSNKIKDLTEFCHMSGGHKCLESVAVHSNPCVCLTDMGFDYRPYLLCCIFSLNTIDGFIVTETERLKGEWLYTQGKGRHFGIGQHKQLIEYLTGVCPLAESVCESRLSTSLDLQIRRALEKRQEYLDKRESPVKMEKDQPQLYDFVPFSSRKTDSPMNQYEIQTNLTNSLRKNVVHSPRKKLDNEGERNMNIKEANNNDSICSTPIVSVRKPTISLLKIGNSNNLEHAAIVVQSWWRGVSCRNNDYVKRKINSLRQKRLEELSVLNANEMKSLKEQLTHSFTMHSVMTELNQKLNEHLKKIQTQLQAETIEWKVRTRNLEERCEQMQALFTACLPTPNNLAFQSLDEGKGAVSWEIHQPIQKINGFNLFVDGEMCGQVGPNTCKVQVVDLDPRKSHKVEIQCISASGLNSNMSKAVVIDANVYTKNAEESSILDMISLKKFESFYFENYQKYYS